MTEMQDIRARLTERALALPDTAEAGHEVMVYLIGWTIDNPQATRAEYQAEMRAVKAAGRIDWPDPRVEFEPGVTFESWLAGLEDAEPEGEELPE